MATTTAHPVARAAGAGSVAIAAPVRGAMIVTGHNNTVEMRLTGVGAVLAFAFRWSRPQPRATTDAPLAPPRFDRHVDRGDGDPQRSSARGGDAARRQRLRQSGRRQDVPARRGAQPPRRGQMRDGTIYLAARRPGRRGHPARRSSRSCSTRRVDRSATCASSATCPAGRALVALEDAELARRRGAAARARRAALPPVRDLAPARPLRRHRRGHSRGSRREHVAALAEQELGRPLEARRSEPLAERSGGAARPSAPAAPDVQPRA